MVGTSGVNDVEEGGLWRCLCASYCLSRLEGIRLCCTAEEPLQLHAIYERVKSYVNFVVSSVHLMFCCSLSRC